MVSPTARGAMAAAFCIAESAAVPTVSWSVALLLELTGSGWVAVPVAVLTSVVPAGPGDADRHEHGEARTGRQRADVAGDDVGGRRARGLVGGDVGGARRERVAEHDAGRRARPEVGDRQQDAHVSVRRRHRERRERVGVLPHTFVTPMSACGRACTVAVSELLDTSGSAVSERTSAVLTSVSEAGDAATVPVTVSVADAPAAIVPPEQTIVAATVEHVKPGGPVIAVGVKSAGTPSLMTTPVAALGPALVATIV